MIRLYINSVANCVIHLSFICSSLTTSWPCKRREWLCFAPVDGCFRRRHPDFLHSLGKLSFKEGGRGDIKMGSGAKQEIAVKRNKHNLITLWKELRGRCPGIWVEDKKSNLRPDICGEARLSTLLTDLSEHEGYARTYVHTNIYKQMQERETEKVKW